MAHNVTLFVCVCAWAGGTTGTGLVYILTAGDTASNTFAAHEVTDKKANTHAYTLSNQSEQTGAVSTKSRGLTVFSG